MWQQRPRTAARHSSQRTRSALIFPRNRPVGHWPYTVLSIPPRSPGPESGADTVHVWSSKGRAAKAAGFINGRRQPMLTNASIKAYVHVSEALRRLKNDERGATLIEY